MCVDLLPLHCHTDKNEGRIWSKGSKKWQRSEDCLQKWILIYQDQSLEIQWRKYTKNTFHNTFSSVVWSVLIPDRFYITAGISVISYQHLRWEFIALPKCKCGHHFRQKKKKTGHLNLAINVTWLLYFFSRIFVSRK